MVDLVVKLMVIKGPFTYQRVRITDGRREVGSMCEPGHVGKMVIPHERCAQYFNFELR